MGGMTIGCQRLAHQGVDPLRFERAEDVVRWMGAMQAQDYGQAVWAIGARMQGGTLAAVEQAIAEGRILRTWPMRGTLHFVPAEDAGWMVALSKERQLAASRGRRQQLGLDEAALTLAHRVFGEALAGGKRLTRPAMLALLSEAGIDPAEQRGYHVLYHAAQSGLIAVGPMEGKQQTFALLAPGERLSGEDGLGELARRYFQSHQPATVNDFAWWAGLTLGDARAAWKPHETAVSGGGIHLLPGFDEFLLGYQDRGDVLDARYAERIVPGGNGMFKPMVVADGRVVGTWRREVAKRGLLIEVALFEAIDLDLAGACERVARFLGFETFRLECLP
jgi:hypothetical protein